MTTIIRIVSALGAFSLTTYFIFKGVVLRIPITRYDQGIFFLGLALAVLHAVMYWRSRPGNKS